MTLWLNTIISPFHPQNYSDQYQNINGSKINKLFNCSQFFQCFFCVGLSDPHLPGSVVLASSLWSGQDLLLLEVHEAKFIRLWLLFFSHWWFFFTSQSSQLFSVLVDDCISFKPFWGSNLLYWFLRWTHLFKFQGDQHAQYVAVRFFLDVFNQETRSSPEDGSRKVFYLLWWSLVLFFQDFAFIRDNRFPFNWFVYNLAFNYPTILEHRGRLSFKIKVIGAKEVQIWKMMIFIIVSP